MSDEQKTGATVIVACDPGGVIAVDGEIPWDCPEERAHFRRTTMSGCHTVIMGRKTFESLPVGHRPLRNRITVILTHDLMYNVWSRVYHSVCLQQMTVVADSLNVALQTYPQAFIAGGADVYEQALRDPRVTEVLISQIHERYKPYDGDGVHDVLYFPRQMLSNGPDNAGWRWVQTVRGGDDFNVVLYRRVRPC